MKPAEVITEPQERETFKSVDRPDLDVRGRSGLRVGYLGQIDEELHTRLAGQRAALIYRQMADNDPTVNAFLFATDGMIRRVPWRVRPAKFPATSTRTTVSARQKKAKLEARHLETVLDDMSTSWRSAVSATLAMLVYGYMPLEIVYKLRLGPDQLQSRFKSRYSDGRVGWRALAPRAPETVVGWRFDSEGGVAGLRQRVENTDYDIPIEKLLLFRVRADKDSPEGKSLLRPVYRSWFFRTKLEEIEAVGAERDLVGYPVMQVPRQLLSDSASGEDKALAKKLWKLIVQTRRDHREGALIPSEWEADGAHSGFKLDLLKGTSRAFDIDVPIKRHRTDMATAFLCGFLLLGMDARGGGRALGGPLIRFFLNSIEYIEDEQEDVFNKYGIPRLFSADGVDADFWPTIRHGNIERVDVQTAATVLRTLESVAGEDLLKQTADAVAGQLDLLDEAPEDTGDAAGSLSRKPRERSQENEDRRRDDLDEGGQG